MDLREQLQRTLGSVYTIERELGGGGMSHVFVAEEHALKRKTRKQKDALIQRSNAEARTTKDSET